MSLSHKTPGPRHRHGTKERSTVSMGAHVARKQSPSRVEHRRQEDGHHDRISPPNLQDPLAPRGRKQEVHGGSEVTRQQHEKSDGQHPEGPSGAASEAGIQGGQERGPTTRRSGGDPPNQSRRRRDERVPRRRGLSD